MLWGGGAFGLWTLLASDAATADYNTRITVTVLGRSPGGSTYTPVSGIGVQMHTNVAAACDNALPAPSLDSNSKNTDASGKASFQCANGRDYTITNYTGPGPTPGVLGGFLVDSVAYPLYVTNASYTGPIDIEIIAKVVVPIPTLASFSLSGSTLTWQSSSAGVSCTASGSWSGNLASTGTYTINPNAAGTYNLFCRNAIGVSGDTSTITFTPPSGGGGSSSTKTTTSTSTTSNSGSSNTSNNSTANPTETTSSTTSTNPDSSSVAANNTSPDATEETTETQIEQARKKTTTPSAAIKTGGLLLLIILILIGVILLRNRRGNNQLDIPAAEAAPPPHMSQSLSTMISEDYSALPPLPPPVPPATIKQLHQSPPLQHEPHEPKQAPAPIPAPPPPEPREPPKPHHPHAKPATQHRKSGEVTIHLDHTK